MYKNYNKCITCKWYDTTDIHLVKGELMDGYCKKLRMVIPKVGNSGCGEWMMRVKR